MSGHALPGAAGLIPASGPVSSVRVPFLDLSFAHRKLAPLILTDIASLIESGAFTNGPPVAEFERAFAEFCGVRACVGTASGLDALRLALVAAGIEPGDEVIVPANTFVATLEAVTQAGGRPVIVDVSEGDYNLDPAAAEEAVGARTRFMLPVHLYGQLADMRRLGQLSRRVGITLIEDACQAHGAVRDGLTAGGVGLAAAFSFYPAKNLGAMGDAGALVTADTELAARVQALREHGQTRKHHHELEGWTARLDTIQALVLLRKLELLDGWNDERRTAAAIYSEALASVGDLRLPPVPEGSHPVWHLYVVRTADPEALAEHLAGEGIGTGRHYPEAVHRTAAYEWLGHGPGSFPVAEALASEALSLPIYPGIRDDQLQAVVEAIGRYFADG